MAGRYGPGSMSRRVETSTIEAVGERLFAPGAAHGCSLALVVMVDGSVAAERYGVQPATPFGPAVDIGPQSPLVSWSMAKSITHAMFGLLHADGLIDLARPAPVPSWTGTPKDAITVLDLLEMRPGLRFVEDYVDGAVSHCLEMLFGSGADDVAAYAAALPLDHPPGSVWNYSSGTTNILCRIAGDRIGGGQAGTDHYLRTRLFGPAGMTSASPRFDAAGTFIGSSYVDATARDFASFGELYRHDGVVDGKRVLPAGWTDHARVAVAADPTNGLHYGRHWWMFPEFPGSLAALGYEGQYIVVVPDRGLTLVHLGKVPAESRPALVESLRAIVRAVEADGR